MDQYTGGQLDEIVDATGKISNFWRRVSRVLGPKQTEAIEDIIEEAETENDADSSEKTAAKNSARPTEVNVTNGVDAERFSALERDKQALTDKLSALEAKNAALEQAVNAQQYRADLAEMERFCQQFRTLGVSADFATDMLTWKRTLGADDFNKLVAYLKSADAAVATSDLFSRRSQRPAVEQDAKGQFSAAVERYMTEHKVDIAKATEAVASANPQLYLAAQTYR